MKRKCVVLVLGVVATLLLSLPCKAEEPSWSPLAEDTITAVGCVRTGVETGCLLLQTYDSKIYNIFADPKPPVGAVITMQGTRGGMSYCMQGEPVKVTKWMQLKMQCNLKWPKQ